MNELKKHNSLAEAMWQFQFDCPAIEKDTEVEVNLKDNKGKYTFWYASYGNIVSTIRQALHNNGLSYSFPTTKDSFICRIKHSSGEFQDTVLDMPKMREKMQENGSNYTFLMRYSLKLALGLDVDGDDDANGADGNEVKFKTPPKEHIKSVDDYIKKKGKEIGEYVVRFGQFKGKKLNTLDHMDIQKYLQWLTDKAKENNKPITGDVLEFYKIAEAYITGDGFGST